jgi:streptogramin lyase
MRRARSLVLRLLIAAVVVLRAAGASAVIITEFPLPTAGSLPNDITTGADFNLWFTEYAGNMIGRITTTTEAITEFPLPTANSGPLNITTGPDGNLWFTEQASNQIGRLTTTGTLTEFVLPTAESYPNGITTGADGTLWFTEELGNQIGRITATGSITEFRIPTASSNPTAITASAGGDLWFTEEFPNQIGRITTAGSIIEYRIPQAAFQLGDITTGPDGNLWFTEELTLFDHIWRMTPAGILANFVLPTAQSNPNRITTGPDGNLWFTENSGKIGSILPASPNTILEIPIPTAQSNPGGITSGPDGNLWFTEGAGKIGRMSGFDDLPACAPAPVSDCATPAQSTLALQSHSPSPVPIAGHSLRWNWQQDAAAPLAQFGDPVSGSTSYALCIYDDANLKMSYVLLPGGTCGTKPCWLPTKTGFKYRTPGTNADGISQVHVIAGPRAKIVVKGKGKHLDLPLPFASNAAVTVQLVKNPGSGSECWSSSFLPPASASTSRKFKDRLP